MDADRPMKSQAQFPIIKGYNHELYSDQQYLPVEALQESGRTGISRGAPRNTAMKSAKARKYPVEDMAASAASTEAPDYSEGAQGFGFKYPDVLGKAVHAKCTLRMASPHGMRLLSTCMRLPQT